MNTKIDFAKRFFNHPLFEEREEVEKILAYKISQEDYDPRYASSSSQMNHPILKRNAIYNLFLKYNLCKRLISEGQDYEQLRKETKETILNHNLRLIYSNIKHFKEKEELVSVGFITIDKAVDRFDFTLGVAFNTYVGRAIYMNCIRELYNFKDLERAPEYSQEQVLSHYQENEEFLYREASEFVNDKILERLGEREREIIERYFGLNGHDAESLRSISASKSISMQSVSQIKARAIKRLQIDCAKYSNVSCI